MAASDPGGVGKSAVVSDLASPTDTLRIRDTWEEVDAVVSTDHIKIGDFRA